MATPLQGDQIFRVRQERCETCLYRLKYPKDTRDRILGDVEASNTYVACHDRLDYLDDDDNTPVGQAICCAGYYKAHPYNTLVMRLAHLLMRVVVVDAEGNELYCPLPQGTRHDHPYMDGIEEVFTRPVQS